MDFISYRGIGLSVVETLSWEREDMLDPSGTTYLDTRWRGSFIAAYNPGAASWVAGGGLNPPRQRAGEMPANTDVAIRNHLSQPRGTLIVSSLGVVVLESPQPLGGNKVRSECDTRTGPYVKVNSIQFIPGERLWKIHLEIETYTNENPRPFVMLSNRWSVYTDVNWQHLTTRTYQGICTVRGDLVRRPEFMSRPLVPMIDSLRPFFAGFSVPNGFQRTEVKVQVYPDGNSVHYSVTDTEQPWNKGRDCPAVRVEIQDSAWQWMGGVGRMMLAGASGVAGVGAASVGALFSGNFGGILSAGGQGVQGIASNLPKYYKRCHVRVWGNQRRPRTDLVILAVSIAENRIGARAFFDTTASEIIVSQDTNNYVDVSYVVSWDFQTVIAGVPVGAVIGAIRNFVPGAVAGPGANSWLGTLMQDPDTGIPAFAGAPPVNITQSPRTANPPFPHGIGTTGTATGPGVGVPPGYVTAAGIAPLITQILEGFNTEPSPVP